MTGLSRPEQAWHEMIAGNKRFVAGTPQHPRQDVERRHELTAGQKPRAAVFGCSDSRLSAEIIFDMGLGDLFVIRNAGQVISNSVVGSIEYAVAVLEVPLVLILGHDECGAVRAAIDSTSPHAPVLPTQVWRQVAPIVPAVHRVRQQQSSTGEIDAALVGQEHLRDTAIELHHSSEVITNAIASGDLGIVAANYRLEEGTAVADTLIGTVADFASP